MNIDIIILLLIECLSLINSMDISDNSTSKMFILTTIPSAASVIPHYSRRRSTVHLKSTTLNITEKSNTNNMSLSTDTLSTFGQPHDYNVIKDGSSM